MGEFVSNVGGSTNYYNISHGSIEKYLGKTPPENFNDKEHRKHVSGADSAAPGTEYYYKTNLTISGQLDNIEKIPSEGNRKAKLSVCLKEGDSKYVIQMELYSNNAKDCLNRMAGILGGPNMFFITAYKIPAVDQNGAKMVKQDGTQFYNYFTVLKQGTNNKESLLKGFYRDDDPTFPKVKKVEIRGTEQKDNTDQINFLFEKAKIRIVDLHKTTDYVSTRYTQDVPENNTNHEPVSNDDDLPF